MLHYPHYDERSVPGLEILNTTVYTKELVLAFQRFNARLLKKAPWSTYALFALLFALLVVGLVYSIIIRGWIYLAIIAVGLVIFGRRFYFLYIAPGRKFDKSSFRDYSQLYTFRKQGFVAAAGENELKRHYEEIMNVYETPEAFYLYFNKGQAFIVAKNSFTQGTADDLRRRLNEKLTAKHYIMINR